MNFLPFAILGYLLLGGSLLVNKIQLQTKQLNPLSYTFYAGIIQILVIVLAPFGFSFNLSQQAVFLSILSGVLFVLALYALFKALSKAEVSVVAPFVGGLSPLFSFLIGLAFLNDKLAPSQLNGFLVIMFGSLVLTAKFWAKKLTLSYTLLWMILAGFLFGLSYVFLRAAFLETSFINGLIISRAAAAFFALSFILHPMLKKEIIRIKPQAISKGQKLIFLSGQAMAGLSNLLIFFAVSLANPALVNSLFGVQYLLILAVALFLAQQNRARLLDENLTKGALLQKTIGAVILAFGVYLLSR